jgi:hypothetical protein
MVRALASWPEEAQVIAHSLPAAKRHSRFLDALPTIDVLMPPLAMTANRGILLSSFPKDRDGSPCVVIDAGGRHQWRLAKPRRFDGFNQPAALSEMNELPQLGQLARCGQLTVIGCR